MAARRTDDPIADFFNLRPVERVYYDGGLTRGHVQPVPEDKREPYLVRQNRLKQADRGQEYVESIRKTELKKMATTMQMRDPDPSESLSVPSGSDLEGIDLTVSLGATVPDMSDVDTMDTDVYDLYDFKHELDSSLPIYNNREMIVSAVHGNQVTILQGPTGCGKSTQVPQYILDDCAQKRKPCNIIITQPRRIAAITVARRVAHERKWQLPSIVGYHVGLNNQTTKDTRLTFCTTGVLVQKIINNKNLLNYTHVILDEVHERDMDMDFAILLVRKLIYSTSRYVKVVLMSATFSISKFKEYFEGSSAESSECMLVPVPAIDIDMGDKAGRFRVKKFYLCQLGVLGEIPVIKSEEPHVHKETYIIANNLIKEFDRLESLSHPKAKTKGAVLVFLPGIHEIETLFNMLEENARDRKWVLQPLHSTITVEEQERVFRPVEKGFRKIILSTNIAESSITVPDIVYVVDFCLTKHMVCDMKTNFSSLQLAWASQTSCTQRAGRCGRVCEGRVYRLLPEKFFNQELPRECVPEIQRAPLAQVVLQSKVLDMGSPKEILALALDPPDLTNIEQTVLLLKEVGALLLEHDGELDPEDGQITFMGRVMARLPLDIKVSRMIILGFLFSVLDECIIMGAAMSLKSMFSSPFQERLKAYNSKLTWADGSCSDLISFLNAYQVWQNNIRQGYFERSVGGGEASWAKRYFIQLNTMKDVHHLVNELQQRLSAVGIRMSVGEHRVRWTSAEKPFVIKVVIAGAFYPNYFVRGASGGQINEQDAVKVIGGHDPFTTVYLNRFPMTQPGELYIQAIKNRLKDCGSDIRVFFDGSSKAYVQFPRSRTIERDDRKLEANIPGRVSLAVYRAVKLRMLNIPIRIHLLLPNEAKKRASELGLRKTNMSVFFEPSRSNSEIVDSKCVPLKSTLPGITDSFIGIKISHFIDPGHFWAHNQINEVDAILRILYMKKHDLIPLTEKPKPGQLLAAPYTDGGSTYYYRARVNTVLQMRDHTRVEVFFVDYGNTEIIAEPELRDFGPSFVPEDNYILNYRAQAFECVLCEIQPSLKCNDKGHWTLDGIKAFKTEVLARTDCELYGQIYSVVDGVVSLELSMVDPRRNKTLKVNEWLIQKNFADRAEESYLSKINHDARQQLMASNTELSAVGYPQDQDSSMISSQLDLMSPLQEECNLKVDLGGPFSPLEMTIYGQTYAARERDLTVEGLSVNSVLLDIDPQDPHDRLLVAAVVEEKSSGNSLILRHTTMMPNIHGFGALMAILFAPTIELRVNEARTRFTGALCGLGCDNYLKHPLFLEHDMDVTFDVDIDIEDLQNVNRLRYWMNMGLTPQPGTDVLVEDSAYMNSVHHKLKDWLMKLVMKRHKSQELCMTRKSFMWGELNEEWLMDPCSGQEDDSSIFKLHWGVNLLEEDETRVSELSAHVNALRLVANGTEPVKEATCKLCQVTVNSAQLLRLHLESAQHRDREQNLPKAMSRAQPG